MAKLRHMAVRAPDLEKAAAFYRTVFEPDRSTGAGPGGGPV